MRTKDRELLRDETGRRLESMLRRIGQVKQVFLWLRPHQSHAQLRRAVARLRSGAMPSIDSRIPSHVLADLMERSIEQDQLVREIRRGHGRSHGTGGEVEKKVEGRRRFSPHLPPLLAA